MIEWLNQAFPNPWIVIVLLTLFPALELRASIPYGILVAREDWFPVVALAVVVNILLGPLLYFLFETLLHLALRIRFIDRVWQHMILKTQKKIHPLVEKYGVWGLSVFIGIPLPGSGVYSGAVGGYLLGFTRKEFYISTVLGVLIAAALVTAVVLTGAEAFDIFIKRAATTQPA